ncbi:MAG: ATP-binding cassette domain-containing protein [Firmicutes bacterium]|nr:ATP-binding cassette domain-containing protein [Bacillota bacterium]
MNKILTIRDLTKSYHDMKGEILAVDGINLDVYDKEFIAIVGPSGCGKTSLLSILSNLEKQSSGTITYYKDDIKIGYMLQKDALFPWRTILDNCLIGLEINHTLNENSKKRVIQLLNTYGLGEFIYKYPNSLSGGMRQRVALIRTLAVDPDILLLDEPFARYC